MRIQVWIAITPDIDKVRKSLSFSDFLQCIKRLYNCQEAGVSRDECENVELCKRPPKAVDSIDDGTVDKPPVEDEQGGQDGQVNGHGKPVGPIRPEDMVKPSTTTTEQPSALSTISSIINPPGQTASGSTNRKWNK